jgi:microcystin-dependent protein
MSTGDFDVLHVKGDVDLNRLKPRNAIVLQGSPGTAGEVVTSQGPGMAPQWAAGGGGGGGAVSSVFGRTGAVTAHTGDYTATEVGAVDVSAEGVANGVATLDSTGNVPFSQLGNVPSGGSGNVPIGAMIMSVLAISDPNWLLCNGGTFSAVTYPALNSFLGGNTLPDMRNLSPMGAGATVAIGATAGALTHTLTTAQLASHTHTGDPHTHSHTHTGAGGDVMLDYAGGSVAAGTGVAVNAGTLSTNAAASSIGTTGGTGSGSSFSILSPVTGVYWYIRGA